ncbi:sugar nucleotide-binding protein [Verrucomicrobiota bacterium]
MKRLLITGASGMLGGEILVRADSMWNAVGACHRTPRKDMLQLDFVHPDELEQKITQQPFTHIIHCAAIRNPDYCLKNPEETESVNVRGSRVIAKAVMGTGN